MSGTISHIRNTINIPGRPVGSAENTLFGLRKISQRPSRLGNQGSCKVPLSHPEKCPLQKKRLGAFPYWALRYSPWASLAKLSWHWRSDYCLLKVSEVLLVMQYKFNSARIRILYDPRPPDIRSCLSSQSRGYMAQTVYWYTREMFGSAKATSSMVPDSSSPPGSGI